MYQFFCALCLISSSVTATQPERALKEARVAINRQNYSVAIETLTNLLKTDTDLESARFLLALAYHSNKQYEEAIEAGKDLLNSDQFGGIVAYNTACAYALLGNPDEARNYIKKAFDLGFEDFGNLKSDPDLKSLNGRFGINLPVNQTYQRFKAHNGLTIEYTVLLPSDFNPQKEYSAVVAFAPGAGTKDSANWLLEHVWTEKEQPSDWIIVVPISPGDHWWTHPAHHALEDFLDDVRKRYKIQGNKYHLTGFRSASRAAFTYSGMSKQFFHSLTITDPTPLERWEGRFNSLKSVPIHMVIPEKSDYLKKSANKMRKDLKEHDIHVKVTMLPGEDHLLTGLHHGRFLSYIQSGLAKSIF